MYLAKLEVLFGRVGDSVSNHVGQSKILVFVAGRRGGNLAESVTDESPFGRLNPIGNLAVNSASTESAAVAIHFMTVILGKRVTFSYYAQSPICTSPRHFAIDAYFRYYHPRPSL